MDHRRALRRQCGPLPQRIHSSYKFQPQEMIPVSGHPEVLVPYQELLLFERKGVTSIPKAAGDQVLALAVKGLLDGVDLEGGTVQRLGG